MAKDERLYMRFPNTLADDLGDMSYEAIGVFVAMVGEARKADNDGIFPRRRFEERWSAKLIAQVMAHGPTPVLVLDGDSYLLPKYAEHQQTRADRERLAGKRSAAGKQSGINRRTKAEQVFEQNANKNELEIETEVETTKIKNISSEVAIATARPDVIHLLDLLDSEIIANGGKPPTRSKKNIDAARLLLDRDGLSVAQVEAAIRWCQADEFWRSNILSMSKLRDKYDQLRLAAQRQRPTGTRTEQNLSVVAKFAAIEGAEQRGIGA